MKDIVAAKPDAKINYIYQQTKFPVKIIFESISIFVLMIITISSMSMEVKHIYSGRETN